MSQYLIFQLHGPMASWGVDAPGEVRHTHELPSRSALLGLLAAGVGIRRDDTERLNAFNRHYSLVVCASRNPRWARDYHTVQMPKEVRKARYFSRREELSAPDLLSAIISRRDYYTDAWWMVAVATTPDAPYSLEQLQDGLRHPVFPLYLGRKSHPLALPLAPLLLEGNASDVLRNAYQQYQDSFRELKVSLPKLQDECWWEGEHDGLVASKILRRRDVPLNRQQWLWDLFPGGKERQFLYRREELQGAFRFFVLSQERPAESETFTIECRSFVPELRTGQQLCFNLRANPTICKAGKRHDLLMEAKRQVRGQAEGSDVWLHQQQAALDWLAAQGERSGFTLLDTSVDAYRQQQLRRENSRQLIQFSSVDYTGMLTVTDPGLFLQRLSQGYGKSRAFGCGLMLIKPGAEV